MCLLVFNIFIQLKCVQDLTNHSVINDIFVNAGRNTHIVCNTWNVQLQIQIIFLRQTTLHYIKKTIRLSKVINSSGRYLFVTINYTMINFGHRTVILQLNEPYYCIIFTQQFRKCLSSETILYINCNFKTTNSKFWRHGRVLCHTYDEYVLTLHQIRTLLL